MILSDLVGYRNKVNNLSIDEFQNLVDQELTKIIGDVASDDTEMEYDQYQIEEIRSKIIANIVELNHQVSKYRQHLNEVIKDKQTPYIQKSYQQYEEFLKDPPEYIIDRHLFKTLIYKEDVELHFLSRIKHNASWKVSGLFIRPETGKYVDPMITCNPLYIVDDHQKLLDSVKRLWNTEFQERLIYKLIKHDGVHLSGIPKNQLGLVVAMNYFNYRPLDIMREYFKEIYDALRPGGIFIFTYNNCDLPGSVRNFENSMYSYTPGSLVQAMCQSLGFEIVNVVDYETINVSWLEIKKPGEIKSMRGGQELAKIIYDPADKI